MGQAKSVYVIDEPEGKEGPVITETRPLKEYRAELEDVERRKIEEEIIRVYPREEDRPSFEEYRAQYYPPEREAWKRIRRELSIYNPYVIIPLIIITIIVIGLIIYFVSREAFSNKLNNWKKQYYTYRNPIIRYT